MLAVIRCVFAYPRYLLSAAAPPAATEVTKVPVPLTGASAVLRIPDTLGVPVCVPNHTLRTMSEGRPGKQRVRPDAGSGHHKTWVGVVRLYARVVNSTGDGVYRPNCQFVLRPRFCGDQNRRRDVLAGLPGLPSDMVLKVCSARHTGHT